MKKFLVFVLGLVLVLGFSASSFALHKVEETAYSPGAVTAEGVQVAISGSLRMRGEFTDNIALTESNKGENDAAYDTRIRLMFKAQVTPQTYGVLELEDSNGDDGYIWGDNTPLGNTKPEGVSIRQAFIAHQGSGLLGTTAGLKVGHMLLALGNGLFYDHTKFGDDSIILWTGVGEGEVSYIYVKESEGDPGQSVDDVDAHVLALAYPMGNVNLSADVAYLDQRSATGNPANHLWNLGLRGDTDVAGLKLKGDVELQTGSYDIAGTNDEVDYKGYAVMVGADYAMGDVMLNAEFAYGTGDDDPADQDYEQFIASLSSEQHYTYVYEYRTISAAGATSTGLANTWYVNLGASAKPTPDLTVAGDIYMLRASEDVSLNGGKEDDDLGWELDGKVEYQIDKNLVYFIEGGYLWPGDAYKHSNGNDADDAYAIRNGVLLKF